jgi:hypothetical protein
MAPALAGGANIVQMISEPGSGFPLRALRIARKWHLIFCDRQLRSGPNVMATGSSPNQ